MRPEAFDPLAQIISAITESDLPLRFGWALLHSTWIFTLVGLAYWIVNMATRRYSSNTRYLISTCALLATAIFFFAALFVGDVGGKFATSINGVGGKEQPGNSRRMGTLARPSSLGQEYPSHHPNSPLVDKRASQNDTSQSGVWQSIAEQSSVLQSGVLQSSVLQASVLKLHAMERWLPAVFLVWLVGMLLLQLRLLVGLAALSTMARSKGLVLPDRLQDCVDRLRRGMQINRPVRVAISTAVAAPTVFGWFRPIILLPWSATTGLSVSQLEDVLAHELAHIRRHDYLVGVLQLLIESVFFYHPVVWWISHQIRVQREECCDDVAVAVNGDRVSYAKSLLRIAELCQPDYPTSLAMSVSGGDLRDRISRLLKPGQNAPVGGLFVWMLLTVTFTGLVTMVIHHSSAIEQVDQEVGQVDKVEQADHVEDSSDPPAGKPLIVAESSIEAMEKTNSNQNAGELLQTLQVPIRQRQSFPIEFRADDMRWINAYSATANGLRISGDRMVAIPIHCKAGITGAILVGSGRYEYDPCVMEPDSRFQPFRGQFRSVMLRFHPEDASRFLPLEGTEKSEDAASFEIAEEMLRGTFRHCWHRGMEALLPGRNTFVANVYSLDDEDLLISTDPSETILHDFTDKETIYQRISR